MLDADIQRAGQLMADITKLLLLLLLALDKIQQFDDKIRTKLLNFTAVSTI